MTPIHWMDHVQNCWARDFEYEQYAELAEKYKCRKVSRRVYAMLGAALHQDMVENIGPKTHQPKEEL